MMFEVIGKHHGGGGWSRWAGGHIGEWEPGGGRGEGQIAEENLGARGRRGVQVKGRGVGELRQKGRKGNSCT